MVHPFPLCQRLAQELACESVLVNTMKGEVCWGQPTLKTKRQSLMTKPFAFDSFSLPGMGEQNVGSHLVTMRIKSQNSEKGRADVWKDAASMVAALCCHTCPELSGLQTPHSMRDKKTPLKTKIVSQGLCRLSPEGCKESDTTERLSMGSGRRRSLYCSQVHSHCCKYLPFRVGSDWVSHFLGGNQQTL